MWQSADFWQINYPGGPSWPSLSFAVLVIALLVTGYVAWRRYLSRQMLLHRIAELEALSDAGRAIIAAELDLQALCQLIADQSSHIIDNSTFQVGLFNDNLFHILFWRVNGVIQSTPRTFDLTDSGGIVGWMRESHQPLLVHDFQREADTLPAQPRYISDNPPRSAIFIPLISGDEVIGSLAAQSNQPSRFKEEDLRRLMVFANQAAAAIVHGRLFEMERARVAHLQLVGQIARQINTFDDLDTTLTQVVHLIKQTFGFHPVTIFEQESTTGNAVVIASSYNRLVAEQLHLERGVGFLGAAIASQQTVICNNVTEDTRFVRQLGQIAPATKSELVVPLLVNGTIFGALDVQSEELGAFGDPERLALETLATELAIGIEKARQLARQREQAWLTTAQLQIAKAVRASDDIDDIVTAVTRLTPMLAGTTYCGILLWDESNGCYDGRHLYGVSAEIAVAFQQTTLPIGDWGALDAAHIGQETITTRRPPPWDKKAVPISLWPIRSPRQIIGMMVVDSPLETAVPPPHLHTSNPRAIQHELLQNIASQTATALESTLLRQAQEEEAWVNTALLQVAEAVNRLIDLGEILSTIVRLVPMLVGVESALILIWDEKEEAFVAGPSHGVNQMGLGLLETLVLTVDEFPALQQSPNGNTAVTDKMYQSLQLPPWLEKAMGTRHAYSVGLNARGQQVGAILVGVTNNGRSLSVRRFNILNGIAQQAATAVVNNHLYKESAERVRLEQELDVARGIQASLIPSRNPDIPGCSIAAYWQAARQVSGDFYDFLPLGQDRWGIVVADVADKGVPAALFMALSRTILRAVAFNRVQPAEVLSRVNQIIDAESQSDLFVTMFYAVWHPKTRQLIYANGGHNPPLVLRHNGQTELLQGKGMALGILPDIPIEACSISLKSGDTVIFYTDGVTEAMNEDYDEFGLGRLQMTAKGTMHQSAQEILHAISSAIIDHTGDTPQHDDITLVIMKTL